MATSSLSRSELMFLGQECHHPSCHLHDVLPFSCPACHQSYCQPHFLPSQHQCTAPLPPSMIDRIAPKCPLCEAIVPTPKSGEPNEAVELHITSGTCPGLEGGEARRKEELRRKKDRGEVCWRKGCSKTLIVQMKCLSCGHDFCPTHRQNTSHNCTPNPSRSTTPQAGPSSSSVSKPTAKAAMSRFLPPSMQPPSTASTPKPPASKPVPQPSSAPKPITASITEPAKPFDAKAAAAAAALRRAGQDVKAPFVKSKTDKRAADEIQSQIKALQARHDKGLLSKTEELRYAELVGKREAARRGVGKKDDGCVVG